MSEDARTAPADLSAGILAAIQLYAVSAPQVPSSSRLGLAVLTAAGAPLSAGRVWLLVAKGAFHADVKSPDPDADSIRSGLRVLVRRGLAMQHGSGGGVTFESLSPEALAELDRVKRNQCRECQRQHRTLDADGVCTNRGSCARSQRSRKAHAIFKY